MTISILIADDHQVVRLGLRNILEGSGIEVTAEAATGEEALQSISLQRTDVVLLDVRMPGSLQFLQEMQLTNES